MGESHAHAVDVRIVAATNRRLKDEVDAARFRADLFFRLAVVSVHLPPLRERKDEILPLAAGFLREHGRGLDDVVPADRQRLLEYRFPGNVRELKNMLLRACALTDLDEQIALAFDDEGEAPPPPVPTPARAQASAAASLLKLTLPDARRALVDDLDRRYLEAVLDASDGNVSEAAKRAGVARSYLHRLLAKHKGALRRRARW